MQLDMHYYGVYALARAAGIKPETARIIAHASQFVDDAIDDESIVLEDKSAVLPTMTAHKSIDYQNTIPGDQWKVWVPFHFLPGDDSSAQNFVERMVCRKNSVPAREILKHALRYKKDPIGPHMAGITAHIYADTFAHYGFVGLARDWNKVKNDSIEINVRLKSILNYVETKLEAFKARLIGTFAEAIPVGHGAVATLPDRPYLKWRYAQENGNVVVRNNLVDYLDACKKLHTFFGNFVKNNPAHGDPANSRSWESIKSEIKKILEKESPKDRRIDLWRKAIAGNKLFHSTGKDKRIKYSEKEWKSAQIVYHFSDKKNLSECDGYLFFQAAWKYRNYVLHELLPGIGLIA
jgi:hypothetical protein